MPGFVPVNSYVTESGGGKMRVHLMGSTVHPIHHHPSPEAFRLASMKSASVIRSFSRLFLTDKLEFSYIVILSASEESICESIYYRSFTSFRMTGQLRFIVLSIPNHQGQKHARERLILLLRYISRGAIPASCPRCERSLSSYRQNASLRSQSAPSTYFRQRGL